MQRLYTLVLLTVAILSSHGQLLYEISGNNTHARSYLLATNRLADQQFIDTIPNVFKAFAACDKVINEFTMQDYEAIRALRQASILPDSIKLSNFYTDEEYQQIDEALQITLGMGWDKLCRMKPSYLTEMYRTELCKRWLAYDDTRSMESFFEIVAQEKGIPIYGLDNIGETMYMLFDREPFEHQCKDLKKVIDYPENEIRQERTLLSMYYAGRLTDIAYQVEGPDNTTSLSYSDYKVYCQRNKEWVKRLTPYLKEGKAFITLNALYLGGDKGLIAGLKEAGYKVRPANRAIKIRK